MSPVPFVSSTTGTQFAVKHFNVAAMILCMLGPARCRRYIFVSLATVYEGKL